MLVLIFMRITNSIESLAFQATDIFRIYTVVQKNYCWKQYIMWPTLIQLTSYSEFTLN